MSDIMQEKIVGVLDLVPDPDLTIEVNLSSYDSILYMVYEKAKGSRPPREWTHVHVKTWARLMTWVSKPFEVFLRPDGRLGTVLKEHGQTFIEADGDDDGIAMILLLLIINHRLDLLPDYVPVDIMACACVLVDKYMLQKCTTIILKNLTCCKNVLRHDYSESALMVSYFFKFHDAFNSAVQLFIRKEIYGLDFIGYPFPQAIVDMIQQKRDQVRARFNRELRRFYYDTAKYGDRISQTPSCHKTGLEQLISTIRASAQFDTDPIRLRDSTSIEAARASLIRTKINRKCLKCSEDNYGGEQLQIDVRNLCHLIFTDVARFKVHLT